MQKNKSKAVNTNQVKGKGLLKVSSILLIIVGIFWIILGTLSIVVIIIIFTDPLEGIPLTDRFSSVDELKETVASVIFPIIGMLVISVFDLVAGILGIKKSGISRSAKPCIVFGLIMIVLYLFLAIINFFVGLEVLISLGISVLYFIGAYKNIKG